MGRRVRAKLVPKSMSMVFRVTRWRLKSRSMPSCSTVSEASRLASARSVRRWVWLISSAACFAYSSIHPAHHPKVNQHQNLEVSSSMLLDLWHIPDPSTLGCGRSDRTSASPERRPGQCPWLHQNASQHKERSTGDAGKALTRLHLQSGREGGEFLQANQSTVSERAKFVQNNGQGVQDRPWNRWTSSADHREHVRCGQQGQGGQCCLNQELNNRLGIGISVGRTYVQCVVHLRDDRPVIPSIIPTRWPACVSQKRRAWRQPEACSTGPSNSPLLPSAASCSSTAGAAHQHESIDKKKPCCASTSK